MALLQPPTLTAHLHQNRVWTPALLFVAAYVLLDWVTYVSSLAPHGITPWNPALGLAFGLAVALRPAYAGLMALAAFLSDVTVRGLGLSWFAIGVFAVVNAAIYTVAVIILVGPKLRFDRWLTSIRDVVLLLGVTISAAGAAAIAYAVILAGTGELALDQLTPAIMRYWVGDIIGILVVAPFVLVLAGSSPVGWRSSATLTQAVAILGSVAIAAALSHMHDEQLLYLLLVPIVWIAVTSGLEGVAAALLLTQIGVMAAQHFATPGVERVTSYQAVLIVLATTGLTIGVLISERSRNERRLRLQQDAIARVTRLGSVGELAAALAHELNQPLTAAGNYGRAALGLMRRSPQSPTEAVDAVAKAVEQIDRGSAVMRKLRRFIQVGELERRAHAPKAIIEESLDLVRHDLPAPPVAFSVLVPADVPRVLADLVHIEQVLVNLIRNAVEALTAADTPAPRIAIAARAIAGGYVEFTVTDNGPGFPPEFRLALSVPLASTKVDGLGVGLSLCQSIVRAHDGVLRIDNSPGGAIVSFTLPVSPGKANGTID